MDMMRSDVDTFLPVFSMTMNFPSEEHSEMETGPLALLWYVVFADISPFTTWLTLSDESKEKEETTGRFSGQLHSNAPSITKIKLQSADLRPNTELSRARKNLTTP